MTYFFFNEKLITKVISMYMILMFLCLPTWNLVSNNYTLENNIAIELEEVLESEVENSSEKEISEKYKYHNQIQLSTKKNEVKQVSILYAFKYLNTILEILTPPPELV